MCDMMMMMMMMMMLMLMPFYCDTVIKDESGMIGAGGADTKRGAN